MPAQTAVTGKDMTPIIPSQSFPTMPLSSASRSLHSIARVVAFNLASMATARFISLLVGFATNVYLARRISPSAFGAVTLAQAVMTYLAIISDSGLSTIAIREGSQHPGTLQALISSVSALRVLLASACMVAGFFCAEFLPYSANSRRLLRMFALSLPAQALAVDWTFRALQKMHFAAIVQITGSVLTLLLTLTLIKTPAQTLRVPIISLLVSLLGVLVSLRLLRHAGYRIAFTFAPHVWKIYLTQSLPLCASTLARTLYTQLNYLILGGVQNDAAVGCYAAASRIELAPSTCYVLYYLAIGPALMNLYRQSKEAASLVLSHSVRLTSTVSLGIFSVGFAASPVLVRAIFGPPFAAAGPVLMVMLATTCVVAVGHNWAQLAIAARRERLLFNSVLLGGATNLLLCSLLVKPLGPLGAAIGTLVAEVAVHVQLFLRWPHPFRIAALRRALGPVISCGCALGGASIAAPQGGFITGSVSALVYTAGLIATRSLTLMDIRNAASVMRFSQPQPAVPDRGLNVRPTR